jgi:hypothetical protein
MVNPFPITSASFRMRKLDMEQTITLVGAGDVTDTILTEENKRRLRNTSFVRQEPPTHNAPLHEEVTSSAVLRWCVLNTVQSNEEGLFQWSLQGIQFCMFKNDKSFILQDDPADLMSYYGASFQAVDMTDAFENQRNIAMLQCKTNWDLLDCISRSTLRKISTKILVFGKSLCTKMNGFSLDIECEREVELEQENEIEVEVEVPAQTAVAEKDWAYQHFVNQEKNPLTEVFSGGPIILNLTAAVDKFVSFENGAKAGWLNTSHHLWCTENFMVGIIMGKHCSLNSYLRPIDSVVLLKGGMVFLSDREADALLRELWNLARQGSLRQEKAHFMMLTNFHLLRSRNINMSTAPSNPLNVVGSTKLLSTPSNNAQLAVAHLFNGGTTFEGLTEVLKDLLEHDGNKSTAKQMVHMRGAERWFDGSDLEHISSVY